MENSTKLQLPYIMPSQAQKHVTHNEAIRMLDSLIQLTVISRSQQDAPADITDGHCYIIPTSASGAFADKSGMVASMQDGAWMFHQPVEGWRAWIIDEEELVVYANEQWQSTTANIERVQSIGINTDADETNRLAVKSDSVLFSHDDGTSGSGDVQLSINKAEQDSTASLMFQSDWQSKAEIGLIGDNKLAVKSDDGNGGLHNSIEIAVPTGIVSFPNGAKTLQCIRVEGRWIANTDNRWVGFNDVYGAANPSFNRAAGTDIEPELMWTPFGPALRAGDRIQGISGLIRANGSDVTGINLRIYHQHGPTDGSWGSDANTTRNLIYAVNGFEISRNTRPINIEFSPYDCPEIGFLLIYLQPIGTLTEQVWIISSLHVDVISN